MKGGPWPALLPFLSLLLTFAAGEVDAQLADDLKADCPTYEGTSLLQTPQKASHDPHAQAQQKASPAKDCLSFIHIPKTGGQSMETARLNSAGIRAPEGKDCAQTIRSIRNGSQRLLPRQLRKESLHHGTSLLGVNAKVSRSKSKLGRFWGSCDDQLHCSYPNVDGSRCFPLIHGTLARSFSGHDGKHLNKSCSKWHVPPGLDPVLARSLTSDCDAFAVVREPMERMISEFNWLRKDCCSSRCFEAFVQKSLREAAAFRDFRDCHFLPQVYYVFENGDHQKGKRLSRHILKIRNLSQEFPALMARYGYENVQLGEHQHPGRPCHVKPTKKTQKLVKEFYAADYEAFGF